MVSEGYIWKWNSVNSQAFWSNHWFYPLSSVNEQRMMPGFFKLSLSSLLLYIQLTRSFKGWEHLGICSGLRRKVNSLASLLNILIMLLKPGIPPLFSYLFVFLPQQSTYSEWQYILISRQLNKTQVNDDNYSYMVYADSVCKDIHSSKSPKAVQIILTLSTLSEKKVNNAMWYLAFFFFFFS